MKSLSLIFLLCLALLSAASGRLPASIAYFPDRGRVDTVQERAVGSPLLDRNYDALGRLTRYQHGSDYVLEWIYLDIDPVNKNAFLLRNPGNKGASGAPSISSQLLTNTSAKGCLR